MSQVTVLVAALIRFLSVAAFGCILVIGGHASSASIIMVSDHDPELIARTEDPISLGTGPTLITLNDVHSLPGNASALSTIAGELAPGKRIYLVLREPHADHPPGVIYHIYLELPAGAHPARDDPHYVGALNFYPFANQGEGDTSISGHGRWRSYDVTEVAIRLAQRNLLTAETSVTIIPAHRPLAGVSPKIAQIEIAWQ